MDENVKNKQISDEELENVGGGEIIRIGESMENRPAGKINYSDYLIYGKKEFVTRTCELCGNKFVCDAEILLGEYLFKLLRRYTISLI